MMRSWPELPSACSGWSCRWGSKTLPGSLVLLLEQDGHGLSRPFGHILIGPRPVANVT